MLTSKKALIEWLPRDRGGRTKPPLGLGDPPYATVVHFTDEPWPHVAGSWSLVITKVESLSSEYRWVADVRFLVNEAPHDSLREGRASNYLRVGTALLAGTSYRLAKSRGSQRRRSKKTAAKARRNQDLAARRTECNSRRHEVCWGRVARAVFCGRRGPFSAVGPGRPSRAG